MRIVMTLLLLAACRGGSTGLAPSPAKVEPATAKAEPALAGSASAQPAPEEPAPEEPAPPGSARFELPEVSAHGFEAAGDDITIVVSLQAIVVEGQSIVSLTDGVIDPAEKEGGALGLKIPRLTAFLARLRAVEPPTRAPQLLVAADRRIPYRALMEVLYSATQPETGYRRLRLAARAGAQMLAAPIELPKGRPPDIRAAGAPARAGAPVRMIASITKQRILVWSLSGLEGTLAQPKAAIDQGAGAAEVTRVLAEIVRRRWSATPRAAEDRTITVQADIDTPAQRLVELLGAVRATPDGTELFPDVALSAGFE